MTRLEALAEMAARHEMSSTDVQEALAVLLLDLINRRGPSGVPVRSQDDIVTTPNLAGNRAGPPEPLPGEPPDESPGETLLAHPDIDEVFLRAASDTPVTVTVPRHASGGFKVGGAINLQQGGPGPSVVVPEDDTVSLSSSTTPKI